MAFKKHFKVLLPLLILVAQAVSGVFGFILFGWLSTALDRIGGENSGLEEFFAYVSAFIVLTMTTSVTPFINLELEKGGYIQKIWNTAEVLVVQSVCSAFFMWQHCKVYFRPLDASWLGDALVTLIPMIIGLSNVLAMLIQIAIYAILNHRKNQKLPTAANDEPQQSGVLFIQIFNFSLLFQKSLQRRIVHILRLHFVEELQQLFGQHAYAADGIAFDIQR